VRLPFLHFPSSSLLFSQIAETEMKQLDDLDAQRAKELEEAYVEHEERAKNEALREMEERMAEESRIEEAREMASSLLRPLTAEEKAIVDNAIYGLGPTDEIMAQVGTDSVQRESMKRLRPGEWLNDEVIHYFYIMLSKRDEEMCRLDPKRKRTHFFKSFFMTKLLNEGNANPALDGKYTYSNVKRWSKKVPGKDIFALNKIFFPINQGQSHWVCAVVFMQEKRIQMYDSMRSPGRDYLEAIFQYLKDEHLNKKNAPLPEQDQWRLVTTEPGTPNQRNGK
jgi:sentrin-specific protease 1